MDKCCDHSVSFYLTYCEQECSDDMKHEDPRCCESFMNTYFDELPVSTSSSEIVTILYKE